MALLRQVVSQLLQLRIRALWTAGLVLLMAALCIFTLLVPAIRAEVKQPNFELPDLKYVRPPSVTFSIFETLGVKGRQLYLGVLAVDLFVPTCYSMLLGAWMAHAWKIDPKPLKHESPVWMLPLLPLVAGAFDFLENGLSLFHMFRLPQRDIGMAWVGTVATFAKHWILNITTVLILLAYITRRIRSKAGKSV